MQRNKDIHSLSHIGNFGTDNLTITDLFSKTLTCLDLSYINKLLNRSKSKGVPAHDIFKTIFLLSFLDLGNVYQLVRSGLGTYHEVTKDMYYQFMKNTNIDWRTIVWLFIKRILTVIESKGNSCENESPKCLIIDDTIIPKTGKTIEFIGKVYNHVTTKYELGMKVLTLGYWDGKTFLPIDFSLHNEAGKWGNRGLNIKELKNQYSKARDESCLSAQRITQLSIDKISAALLMIKQYSSRIKGVQYVLADSWFISEIFIRTILNLKRGINVIGIMKTNRNVTIDNESISAKNVPTRFKKDISRSTKYNCEYISKVMIYKDIKVNGYWVRMRGQQKWQLLICSDLKLRFTKAMQYYQIRWSIEVFFKDCKQKLRLNTSQSTDFDAHIAHISIVYLNYAALALRQRFDAHETLGQLFSHVKSILLEATIVSKIWAIFSEIYVIVLAPLGTEWALFIQSVIENKNKIDSIIEKLFSSLSYAYVDSREF
jgi:DDE superfamily endonuclease